MKKVPKTLFTSWREPLESCDLIQKLVNLWKEKNPTWEVKYFDDSYLDMMFSGSPTQPVMQQAYKLYNKIHVPVGKSDLFRSCYAFINGGIWFDFDTVPFDFTESYGDDVLHDTDVVTCNYGYGSPSYMLFGGAQHSNLLLDIIKEQCINYEQAIKKNLASGYQAKIGIGGYQKVIRQHFGHWRDENNKPVMKKYINDDGSLSYHFLRRPKGGGIRVGHYVEICKKWGNIHWKHYTNRGNRAYGP